MIVLGADAHKRSHTIAAVSAATGELLGEQTVQVGARGFAALLGWARGLGGERVWAIEDCRHVSGSFERFLIGRGERVLRVTTRLMAASRRGARARGKSDSIDAIAVARAALRVPTCEYSIGPRATSWWSESPPPSARETPARVAASAARRRACCIPCHSYVRVRRATSSNEFPRGRARRSREDRTSIACSDASDRAPSRWRNSAPRRTRSPSLCLRATERNGRISRSALRGRRSASAVGASHASPSLSAETRQGWRKDSAASTGAVSGLPAVRAKRTGTGDVLRLHPGERSSVRPTAPRDGASVESHGSRKSGPPAGMSV